MQQPVLIRENQNTSRLQSLRKRREILSVVVTFAAVLGLSPLITLLGLSIGFSLALGAIGAVAVTFIAVRWPTMGFFIILVCAVVFEEDPLQHSDLTDKLHIYFWPSSLTGIPERPIGILFLLILFAFLAQIFMKRERALRGGELIWPFLGFLACVVFGIIHGLSTGGSYTTIVLEVRPFWYLFITYLLAYNLVSRKSQIRAFFWIVIIGAGIKGLQGCYIYFLVLHRNLTNSNEIMAHEESFFFAALILLVIIFCLHYRYRPQLFVAIAELPFVIIAMVANERRADYVALGVGFMVAWILIFLIKKQSRKSLAIGLIVFLVIGGGYVAIFANVPGTIGYPARSIVSIISPGPGDARDASSNLYRTIEDFDLKYTAEQSFPLGFGFGKDFLQPEPLPNILSLDPVYLLIPHNTVYWVWMRLGPIGYLLFWYIIGSIIVRGCLIARQLKDRYLQTVAIYIVAVTFMEIVVAYADYQLYAFRNVIYLGLLIGVLLRLPALDKEAATTENSTVAVRPALPLDLIVKQ
jgi:hypothetical protein